MSDHMRILLAELEPAVPSAPVYATWSPTDKHADIALSGGDLVATKTTTRAGFWACVRATTSMRIGQHYWETRHQYTGSADVVVGIAIDGASLSVQIGSLPLSLGSAGGPNKSGQCYVAGSVNATTAAVSSGTVVRHWLDCDAGIYRVAVGAGAWVPVGADTGLVQYIVGNGGAYAIAGILRPSGSTATITANFGATPFSYPVPAGCNQGVYTLPAPTRRTIYLSNSGFKTTAAEVPASTYYDGRIAGDSDVEFTRELGLAQWGNSVTARGGELSVVNRDGGIDEWLAWDWRDAPFRLYAGREGDERAAFTLWSYGVVDRIEGVDSRRMRLVLADPLARFDVPVQSQLYPADAPNAALRGKPLPIVLGRPRWCEPQRMDPTPTQRQYRLHGNGEGDGGDSIGIDSITEAFDGGNRFAGPADAYTAHNPLTLANGGNFTTWALDGAGISMPSGFTRVTGYTATDRFEQGAGGGTLRLRSTGQVTTAIYHSVSSLSAGYRYTIAFTVTALAKAGQLTFRASADAVIAITTTGAKSITLDVTTAAQLQLVLGRTELDATIDDLTVSSVQIIDWTYYTEGSDRMGLTLAAAPWGRITCHPVGITVRYGSAALETVEDFVIWIFGRLANYRDITLDFNTGDIGEPAISRTLATYLTSPTTFGALYRQILDSVLAGTWASRSGDVLASRWSEPDPAAAVLTLDERNIVGDIRIELDQAKSLRRRVAGRRNHAVHSDSEIATSVSEAIRQELKSEWGFIANGADAAVGDDRPISAAYQAANDRDPLPTLLQADADISALANAICSLWRPTRYFYDVSAVLDADAADALEPGQTVRLVWSRIAGLAGDVPLRIVRVRSRFWSRRVDLRLWGSPPPITATGGGGKVGK